MDVEYVSSFTPSFDAGSALAAISTLQGILFGAAVCGVLLVAASTIRSAVRRRGERSAFKREMQGRPAAPPTAVSRDIEDIMRELDELARKIQGRLDARLAAIESLVHDADQRIQELSRLVRMSQGAPGVDLVLPAEDPQGSLPLQAESNPLHDSVFRLSEAGMSPIEIAREVSRPTGEIELILSLRRARLSQDVLGAPTQSPSTLLTQ